MGQSRIFQNLIQNFCLRAEGGKIFEKLPAPGRTAGTTHTSLASRPLRASDFSDFDVAKPQNRLKNLCARQEPIMTIQIRTASILTHFSTSRHHDTSTFEFLPLLRPRYFPKICQKSACSHGELPIKNLPRREEKSWPIPTGLETHEMNRESERRSLIGAGRADDY